MSNKYDSSPGNSSSCSDDVFVPHGPIKRNPYKSHSMRVQSEPALLRESFEPVAAKIQFGSRNSNSSWDINSEDWVHVNGKNGDINKTESWQAPETRSQDKEDVWMFEPEGFTLPQQQVENCDPWGIEAAEPETGDWSAPASSWGNANAEWSVPSPVASQPTYMDESSDDEIPKVGISALPTEAQAIVGTSQESGQNKKSKRRRKKKQNPKSDQEQPPATEVELPKEVVDTKIEHEVAELKTKPVEEVSEDWTVPKASKKRKPKARKAD